MPNEKKPTVRYGLDNPHPLSTMKTELVWEGKYDEYGNRRTVDVAGWAMPPQKIETINQPRAEALAQGQLFDDSKALADDFRNMLIWGDNKLVMASLLKDFKGKIDLIYIDPPFDVGADFTMDVPIGDGKETVGKDQSTLEMVAYRDMWGRGTDSYLHMMYERLALMRDLLSESGSLWLHCDFRMKAYLRQLLEEIFGRENLVNELIWRRRGGALNNFKSFGSVTDTLYLARKSPSFKFFPIRTKDSPEAQQYIRERFVYDDGDGRLYSRDPVTNPASSPTPSLIYEYKGYKPPEKGWAFSIETMREWDAAGKLYFPPDKSQRIRRKTFLDEYEGQPIQNLWSDIHVINSQATESVDYPTQKPEALLDRILSISSEPGDLVADFFCGSGTTGAVAERTGRRWLMSDLGRFAVHTSRKRLIDLQRILHDDGRPYRAFDVYNLGRYERQWWFKKLVTEDAEADHRRVVLGFYKAEALPDPTPLIHGRKGQALVFVDHIDTILTREQVDDVAKGAREFGAKEVHMLSWEFEMDLRLIADAAEAREGVKIKLVPIPREIMEKNRKEPPPFLEVAVLEAEPIIKKKKDISLVDIKLTKFRPSLAEVPSKELEALQERAITSGFDFIDFWSVDFDYKETEAFNHDWQDYRTRKDRSLKTTSEAQHVYANSGTYTACVKVVDVFGCDTSITVEVKV